MILRKAALAVILMLGAAAPALAQQQPAAQPQPPQRQLNLNRAEQQAFQPLVTAAQAGDWAAAEAALPAAAAAARGNDAKYLLGQVRRLVGVNRQNQQLESQGLDEMIASGGGAPETLFGLYQLQFDLALRMNDQPKAERALAEMTRRNPSDVNLVVMAAQLRTRAGDRPGAIQAYRRAIQQQQAAGQAVPVAWRAQLRAIAWQGRLPETIPLMREYLAVEPTTENWHDAMVMYSTIANADPALQLDLFRLMRAANAMTGEGDFMTYWRIANAARLFGEAQYALQEGLNRRLIVQNAADAQELLRTATLRATDDRTSFADERAAVLAGTDAQAALNLGDIYYNYGQYADAAALYRAAVQKGADAAVANLRLGAALALAGQRAEAEAALRAVGAGNRQELAQYWLLWLSSRRN